MGYAARSNPRTTESLADRRLRRLLALFPDRATYEAWLTAKAVDAEKRAHMERYLPDAIKAREAV